MILFAVGSGRRGRVHHLHIVLGQGEHSPWPVGMSYATSAGSDSYFDSGVDLMGIGRLPLHSVSFVRAAERTPVLYAPDQPVGRLGPKQIDAQLSAVQRGGEVDLELNIPRFLMLQDDALERAGEVQLFVDTSVMGRAFFEIDEFTCQSR